MIFKQLVAIVRTHQKLLVCLLELGGVGHGICPRVGQVAPLLVAAGEACRLQGRPRRIRNIVLLLNVDYVDCWRLR